MIAPTAHQSSLFYAAFAREASLIKDDLLEEIGALLDDPALVHLAREALARRAPRSASMGRYGSIAPDQLLRSCALKHIKGWSFRELERETRGSLVYRRFTRFDGGRIPTYKTFSDSFAALGEEGTRAVHERVVRRAVEEGVARGFKLRTDTTVVETNVHYPTDSTLLSDGIRVLTRVLGRVSGECRSGALKVVDHARSTKHRVLEIHRAAKSLGNTGRERLTEGYRRLLGIAGGVTRQAERVGAQLAQGTLKLAPTASVARVVHLEAQLRHFIPLVRKVIAQTQARVFGGDRHVQGKVLSLFEEHTAAIRKGKPHKPTEFGRLVRVDEAENGIVSHYEVQDGNPADQGGFLPAIAQHQKAFGRAPRTATADRGFYSAANVRGAWQAGVKRPAVPGRGRLSGERAKQQKERWFQRAMRWHAGIEARIATLKHRFGMVRAFYKGDRGLKRFVGWSVIAQNLVSIARTKARRKATRDGQHQRAA
jgi:transposase, IS5 family